MNLFEAEVMAKQLLSDYMPTYRFAWNNLKAVNGRCVYAEKTIYLSRHLTGVRTQSAVRMTIMHEIAHAIHPGAGHGAKWKAQMRAFGFPDARCSNDQPDKSTIANWRAVCSGCGKVSYMIRKPRIQRSCGSCSGKVYNPKYLMNFVRI